MLLDDLTPSKKAEPGPGGPGQDVCCDCGTDLRTATVTYGAGTGSGTGKDGFFRCRNCHKALENGYEFTGPIERL